MKKIVIIAAALAIVGVFAWIFMGGSTKQEASMLEPVDTGGEFVNKWFATTKDPAAEPSRATLASSPILSKGLRDRLQEERDATPDRVLCQTVVPDEISIRNVTVTDEIAKLLILSRDKSVTEQSVITLRALNGGWYIDDITCSPGEFEPEREFTFEKEGYLLKGSVPTPYDSKNWHLVFEENGVPGHVVPLFFDTESECVALDGKTKSVCSQEEFKEAMKVSVHGQMSERGVSVKRQEFVK